MFFVVCSQSIESERAKSKKSGYRVERKGKYFEYGRNRVLRVFERFEQV